MLIHHSSNEIPVAGGAVGSKLPIVACASMHYQRASLSLSSQNSRMLRQDDWASGIAPNKICHGAVISPFGFFRKTASRQLVHSPVKSDAFAAIPLFRAWFIRAIAHAHVFLTIGAPAHPAFSLY
jgi:hypothetical protein